MSLTGESMKEARKQIAVVGHGYVGEALEKGMKHAFDVLVHDPFKYPPGKIGSGTAGVELVETLDELTQRAQVVFVAVPTPMNPDGSASTRVVESVVASIAEFGRQNIVVIKSTVPPGTTDGLHSRFAGPHYHLKGVIFSPEFLTEANYIDDFKNQTRIILGGDASCTKVVRDVFKRAYPNVPIVRTSAANAELVKYTTNCFLATKVSFANELFQVCEALNARGSDVDYDRVIEVATLDERLGKWGWRVPGPDGQLGFGLSCFPKDLNALIHKTKELGIDPKLMSAAWEKNLEVREDRDWERMSKAVVDVKEGS